MPCRLFFLGLVLATLPPAGCTMTDVIIGLPEPRPIPPVEPPPGSPPPAGGPLVLSNLEDPPPVRRRLREWGVEAALVMPGHFIDPDDSATWDEVDKTNGWLEQHVPRTYTGFLCLDWESNGGRILRKGPAHPRFREVVGEYAKLALYVKRQRPTAKVGFYGIPITEYWNQSEEWESSARACQPILDACDVVFPTVYDFYAIRPDRDLEKFSRVVRLALEMAGGKPVLMYVQPRYHNSTEEWGFKLIPAEELANHVRSLMMVEHEGRRPAGVVLWGADQYYHRTAQLRDGGRYRFSGASWDRIRARFAEEMEPGETIDQYLGRRNPEIYRVVAEAVRGK
jgi:hypothetical protein